jgi:hypothetical protein
MEQFLIKHRDSFSLSLYSWRMLHVYERKYLTSSTLADDGDDYLVLAVCRTDQLFHTLHHVTFLTTEYFRKTASVV